MKVYSLAIQDSTQPNRKAIITTEVLSFLSVEGLTLPTETDDNHCKQTSALRPLGLF